MTAISDTTELLLLICTAVHLLQVNDEMNCNK